MSKKILIGICGHGLGHSTRQDAVIRYLLNRGHELHLFTFDRSSEYVKNEFSNVKQTIVKVPWVIADKKGINWISTFNHHKNKNINFTASRLHAERSVIKQFGQKPDLVISDYEPISAICAYSQSVPLITMEQQSKYLGYCTPEIGKYHRNEEASRLSLFFPKAHLRISASWFPLTEYEKTQYHVEIISPIIRTTVTQIADVSAIPGNIIVYLSPYCSEESNRLDSLLNTLTSFKSCHFDIFCPNINNKKKVIHTQNATCYSKYESEIFFDKLSSAEAVISNAGHQLLSECIYLNKPVYAIPFRTYEQNYNASQIIKYELGIMSQNLNKEALHTFLHNLNYYRTKIQVFRMKHMRGIGNNSLIQLIENHISHN